ncbi:MAG: hypothetical protein LBU35_03270, partial [Holosporales bacterium]|nr:hypothetical protein [Holosporales bacterium]
MKKCVLLIYAIAIISAACEKKEILPGKREEVFSALNKEADKTIASLKIIATTASSIDSYVDIGGNKRHNHINYQMPQNPQTIWKTDIGRGPITSDPIYINGNIYAIDSLGILCCVSAKDGKIVWKKEIAKQPDESVFSGGL